MKYKLLTTTLLASILLFACTAEKTNEKSTMTNAADATSPTLDTIEAKVSYLIAYNNIKQMTDQEVPIDFDAFLAGAKEAHSGAEAKINETDAQAIFAEFQQQQQAKQAAKQIAVSAENKAKSQAFLTANASKEGVKTTESGLQYKVIKAGTGDKPSAESTVQVNYEGTLIDGTVFDSSFERGQPVEFPLNRVIKGWTEGLQLMSEGSSFEFYIPADIAYGDQAPPAIGPGQTLIFKIDLLQANFKAEKAESAK